MPVSTKAILLAAGAIALGMPLAAPLYAQVPAPQPAPQPAARSIGDTPAVAPRSTVAGPADLSRVPGRPAGLRPYPVYTPDQRTPYAPEDAAPLPTGPVTTLAQAMTLAYANNPRLLSSRASLRSADFRLPAARAGYGPTLGIEGGYTFTRSRAEQISGSYLGQRGFTSTASLILNQPILTFGRNAAAEAGAYAEIAFARDSLRLVETNLMLNVVSSYVSVLRDATAVTIARQNLALLERQFRDSDARFRVREITSTDLQQVETRVELARAQLVNAEGQLGVTQGEFVQFVGVLPGELTQPDLLTIRYATVDDAYADADANSPVIRAAQSREKTSRANYESAKAESRPRIDLRGTGAYGTVSPYSDNLRTTLITGQAVLSQPLIDSGLRRSRQGEAREANDADWRLIDAAVRETRQTVSAAWGQLTASRTSLENYRRAIDAAQRAYDGAVLQERAGDRTTLDVLDLARDLLNVRLNYNTAFANEYIARASLLAAAGEIEAPGIVPGLTAYSPTDHFDRVRRKGDIPLLTPALSALDGVVNGNVTRDRALRDPGAAVAVKPSLPLTAPNPSLP